MGNYCFIFVIFLYFKFSALNMYPFCNYFKKNHDIEIQKVKKLLHFSYAYTSMM